MKLRPLRILGATALAAVIFAAIYAGFVLYYGTLMEPDTGMAGAQTYALRNLAMLFSISGTSVMVIACWAVLRGCGGAHVTNSVVACVLVGSAETGVEALLAVEQIGAFTALAFAMKLIGAVLGGLAAKESDAKTAMKHALDARAT